MPASSDEPQFDSLAAFFKCAQCGETFRYGDSVVFCSEECGDLFDADLRESADGY
jgi:hypothetical protein